MHRFLVLFMSLFFTGVLFAQEVVTTTPSGGIFDFLPASLKENAWVVITVNFVLACLALLLKKVPSKFAEFASKLLDMAMGNPEHKKE